MSVVQGTHLHSPEEEDLIHRSTKKIKDGTSKIMDVEGSSNLVNGEEIVTVVDPKPSYRDNVMEFDPNFDLDPTEIVCMVTEEMFPEMDSSKKNDQYGKAFNPNPTVKVALVEYEEWCHPWKYSLIVKLMGRRVWFRMMSVKLKFLWAKKGDVCVMDVSDDFFLQPILESGPKSIQNTKTSQPSDTASKIATENHVHQLNNLDQQSSEIQEVSLENQPCDSPAILGHGSNTNDESIEPGVSLHSDLLKSNIDSKDISSPAQKIVKSGSSHSKAFPHHPVKPHILHQKNKTIASKKNVPVVKAQKKIVLVKESPHRTDLSSNAESSLETTKAAKDDEWEKEVLALMSRYNNKRWEAHANGEFVGDVFSLNKNNFFEVIQGKSSTVSPSQVVVLNSDIPPDNHVD
ncbi:hypothetical protein SESBI_49638 [Sesbania bispinosa]|nr:hypothetical protein SESBI_49638 [Sesbania bispinosa]